MTGAAIKRIVLKDIKKATIPFPPIKEQDKILGELNSLLVYTQCLAGLFERKLAALAALKKSLLHQAFTGQLGERAA
jgi:type I restriction enzyme S subunit